MAESSKGTVRQYIVQYNLCYIPTHFSLLPYTEIDVINQHNGLIENTISVDLNYFSGKFVEKGFITRDVSGDIAGMYGVGSREKARRLLQAAIGSLKLVPDRQKCVWFHGFVAIFSSEAPYRNLADTLLRAYQPGNKL